MAGSYVTDFLPRVRTVTWKLALESALKTCGPRLPEAYIYLLGLSAESSLRYYTPAIATDLIPGMMRTFSGKVWEILCMRFKDVVMNLDLKDVVIGAKAVSLYHNMILRQPS
jgi:hypothetical protein